MHARQLLRCLEMAINVHDLAKGEEEIPFEVVQQLAVQVHDQRVQEVRAQAVQVHDQQAQDQRVHDQLQRGVRAQVILQQDQQVHEAPMDEDVPLVGVHEQLMVDLMEVLVAQTE